MGSVRQAGGGSGPRTLLVPTDARDAREDRWKRSASCSRAVSRAERRERHVEAALAARRCAASGSSPPLAQLSSSAITTGSSGPTTTAETSTAHPREGQGSDWERRRIARGGRRTVYPVRGLQWPTGRSGTPRRARPVCSIHALCQAGVAVGGKRVEAGERSLGPVGSMHTSAIPPQLPRLELTAQQPRSSPTRVSERRAMVRQQAAPHLGLRRRSPQVRARRAAVPAAPPIARHLPAGGTRTRVRGVRGLWRWSAELQSQRLELRFLRRATDTRADKHTVSNGLRSRGAGGPGSSTWNSMREDSLSTSPCLAFTRWSAALASASAANALNSSDSNRSFACGPGPRELGVLAEPGRLARTATRPWRLRFASSSADLSRLSSSRTLAASCAGKPFLSASTPDHVPGA